MAYRLDIAWAIEAEVQRVATEPIDKALAEIRQDDVSPAETVHQVWKPACGKGTNMLS